MAYEFAYMEGGSVIGPLPTLPPNAAWSKLGMRQQDRLNNGEDSGALKAAYYTCNICFGPVNKNDRPPQRKCDCIRDGGGKLERRFDLCFSLLASVPRTRSGSHTTSSAAGRSGPSNAAKAIWKCHNSTCADLCHARLEKTRRDKNERRETKH